MKNGARKKKSILKLYRFSFDGVALGGTAIVIATNIKEAKSLLAARASDEGHAILDVNAECLSWTNEPQVINFDNGDY